MKVLPFEEVIQDASGGNAKVQKGDYLTAGAYPIVDQGQEFIGGFSNDKDDLVTGEGPWIVFGDHTRALKFIETPFCMGADGVKVLRLKQEGVADLKYIFHFLHHSNIPSAGYSRHYKFLKRLEIPLPPLDEQKRIAAILDKADALRAKRRQAIALLDSLTESIFQEMFGDPVSNPKGWPTESLGKLCDVRDGTHDSPKYVRDGFPLLTSKNFTSGTIDFRDANLISESDFLRINKRSKVELGDIVMPMIGTIGSPVIIDREPNFAIKNVALIKFLRHSPRAEYLKMILAGDFLQVALGKASKGGTQKFISLGELRRLPIPVPPEEIQLAFVELFSRLKRHICNVENSQLGAKLLFSSLQFRAFSGQL